MATLTSGPVATWPSGPVGRVIWLGAIAGLVIIGGLARAGAAESSVDHEAWDQLLRAHVRDGLVDYAAIKADPASLEEYLAALASADPAGLSEPGERAFWINAYNACVVKGVLDRYPLESVRDIAGFFDKIRYRVGGERLTLNQIEARGRALGDWRIHFALVCASSSCPPLRGEAYLPEQLEAQLAEQTRAFLADPERGLRLDGRTLWLSQIFKWYAADFVPRAGTFTRLQADRLLPVIREYLPPELAQAVESARPSIKLLGYDWSLNGRP